MEFAKRLLDRDDSFSTTMLLMPPPFAHNAATYAEKLNTSHPEFQFRGLPSVTPLPLEYVLASPEHFVSIFIADHRDHVKDAIFNNVLSNKSPGLVLDLFCPPFVDVAKDLGVPSYIFFASGAAFLGSMLYLPDRFHKGGTTFKPTDPDSIIPSYMNPVSSKVLPNLLFHGGYSTFVCRKGHGSFREPQLKESAPGLSQSKRRFLRTIERIYISDVVKADKIAKAVKDLIEGSSEVKSRVKAMSEIGRKALLESGSSFVAFETLVSVLSGNKA
ncbi:PREDICTED: putative UDP-glucose flavonoid 3-O-glucosyltransferase 3 [Populus euphratica]|uniref:UDP-glucose flavonoid 3-O-glucosyltransferase 3 n=1 Tax=Populus euphratica TaxID=75702 RepID=A0AAJ6X7V9_POPEU|nr:PREDICTED: putative UDP-glucose flavonoid 3-O-glucosyltransferase 3 [Populus euphratica]